MIHQCEKEREREEMDYFVGFGFVIVIIIIGLCSCCLWWWDSSNRKNERYAKSKGFPKGNSSWPFIGETLHFISSGYSSRPVAFMETRKSLYGKVFKTHLLGKSVIVSTDPEVNKVILQNHGNIFVPSYPKTVTELLGKTSILQMNGSLHKRIHALIGNFFKSAHLKTRITKDIENSVKLSLASWGDMPFVYVQDETKKAKERMLQMVQKLVDQRKIEMDDKLSQPKDAVDVLLRESTVADSNETQRLPLDFISGNIIEMMIPGEDSVPMVITLAVKFLSDCPVALNQLMEENMELKRKKTHSRDDYAWTDYLSMPFTQNVINETLRMANIINAVWRKTLTDVKIKGYLIPKGCCVLASFSSVHMDEEIYENPYQFDPWRWEKKGCFNSSSFTPFGGGQRLCPGLDLSRLEISIFLHGLVTTYSWVAEKDEIIHFPTVKMRGRLPIKVTPIV